MSKKISVEFPKSKKYLLKVRIQKIFKPHLTKLNIFWISGSVLYPIIVTFPAIKQPSSTFVGHPSEDSGLVSGYMNVLEISRMWIFSNSVIAEVGWPLGTQNPGLLNQVTFMSSLATYIVSIITSPLAAQLILVFIYFSSTVYLCQKISYKISDSHLMAVVLCLIVTLSGMSLQWASALPVLGMNSFFLALVYLRVDSLKRQNIFQLKFVLVALLACSWHPYFAAFTCIFLSAITFSEFIILRKISVTIWVTWLSLILYLAAFAFYFKLNPLNVTWTGEKIAVPIDQNIFQYSFFDETSRAYVHPLIIFFAVLVIAITLWKFYLLSVIERFILFTSTSVVVISFITFGAFTFYGFKLPAYFVNFLIPGLRNGQYAVALIQISVSLIAFIGIKIFLSGASEISFRLEKSLLSLVFLISIVSLDTAKFFSVVIRWASRLLRPNLFEIQDSIVRIPRYIGNYFLSGLIDGNYLLAIIQMFFFLILMILILRFFSKKDEKILDSKIYLRSFVFLVIFSFLSNVNFPKIEGTRDRWMQQSSKFELQEIRESVVRLPPGPLLVTPFETHIGNDGITCFFLFDVSHPLVNHCGIAFTANNVNLIHKIAEASRCDKFSVARRANVKYILLWEFSKARSERACLEKFREKGWADQIRIFKHQNIGLWEFKSN